MDKHGSHHDESSSGEEESEGGSILNDGIRSFNHKNFQHGIFNARVFSTKIVQHRNVQRKDKLTQNIEPIKYTSLNRNISSLIKSYNKSN